jgi:hypothetical protein
VNEGPAAAAVFDDHETVKGRVQAALSGLRFLPPEQAAAAVP